jgi:hypothetical protein
MHKKYTPNVMERMFCQTYEYFKIKQIWAISESDI